MGGGSGKGLDFGATYGSGKLSLGLNATPNSRSQVIVENTAEKPPVRDSLITQARTNQVKNLISELYRSNSEVGDGGTADAIRHELATGKKVGNRSHIRKGQERLRQITKILKNNPNHPDKILLHQLKEDLESALGDTK